MDNNLSKQIIDISTRIAGTANNGDFTGQRITAANTVNFQIVTGTHNCHQYFIALRLIFG